VRPPQDIINVPVITTIGVRVISKNVLRRAIAQDGQACFSRPNPTDLFEHSKQIFVLTLW
jgi:hypothetical protein